MANPEHVAAIHADIDEWNRWRSENPDLLPDLSAANLRGASMILADLRHARLRDANLALANLKGADLRWADLRNANLVGARLIGVAQQDSELVAADSRDHVAPSEAAHQQLSNLYQSLVTSLVTERVIDHLQAVEVDEQHRRINAVAVNPRNQPFELPHETATVGKVDQRILMGERIELLDALLQAGDLGPQQADLFDQPLAIVDVHDVR